ncbi:MAG: sigma-54 dependent transcriptional regulator [bacterium]
MKKILIVDDEPNFLTLLGRTLKDEGYQVTTAATSYEAISLAENTVFDTLITDLAMPEVNGIELMERFRKLYPNLPIIIITGVGTVERAVEAMKKGAYDFITKPFELDKIRTTVKRALEYGELHLELHHLRKEVQNKYDFSNIIAKSKCMQNIFKLIDQVADSMANVLIQGECGTGKELIARAIHYRSIRRDKPFLAIDCSAIPESLLESELFGHTKGSFTGAVNARRGLFEEASEGTIFLDEVGDISIATQCRLLRVIQEKEVRPIGSNQASKIDVRIVTATNKDLRDLIKKQTFREDLYFRVAIIPIYLPPLRERKEDIPLLTAHFIEKYSRLNQKKAKGISREALLALTQYDWPGNVRELENTIERALLISGDGQIDLPHLFMDNIMIDDYPSGDTDQTNDEQNTLTKAIEKAEKDFIIQVLNTVNFNRTHAAKILGISRRTLYDKIEKYNLKSISPNGIDE